VGLQTSQCPLWVISGHVQRTRRYPLCANSGHPGERGSCLRFREEGSRPRQNDPELGELARLRIDISRPAVLLDDDVVTDGQAKAGPFSKRFKIL
jgi:hypothetical protein